MARPGGSAGFAGWVPSAVCSLLFCFGFDATNKSGAVGEESLHQFAGGILGRHALDFLLKAGYARGRLYLLGTFGV